MARLDLYREGRWVGSLALGDRTYLVGRDPTNDLVLIDALASRRHFQLSPEGGGYQMKDLDTGKIVVDGKGRREVVLSAGGAVTLADVVLEFHVGLQGADTTK